MDADLQDYLFDLRGYLILKNAVQQSDVADLNGALDDVPPLEQGEWYGRVQRLDNNGDSGCELQNIVEGGEPFERLIDHPSWLGPLRRFCGESDTYAEAEGLFIDECFASIRRDGGYFPFHSGGYRGAVRGQYRYNNGAFRCGQVNILLALTDVGPGDGATLIVPGSHKANLPHPQARRGATSADVAEAREVHLRSGDALLFVDGLLHGASSRTNPGERRVVIYRYGPAWGSTRYGYRYSDDLLTRLTPERRRILQPIAPRHP